MPKPLEDQAVTYLPFTTILHFAHSALATLAFFPFLNHTHKIILILLGLCTCNSLCQQCSSPLFLPPTPHLSVVLDSAQMSLPQGGPSRETAYPILSYPIQQPRLLQSIILNILLYFSFVLKILFIYF